MLDPVKKKVDEISRTPWIVFSMFVKKIFELNLKRDFKLSTINTQPARAAASRLMSS